MAAESFEPAASAEAVTIRWSPRRVVITAGVTGLLSVVAAYLIVSAVSALMARPMTSTSILATPFVAYPVFYAGAAYLVTRRCPPWLRTSTAGLEVAATRRDPIFVPWSAVASIRFLWHGPLTVLEIVPTDPALVLQGHRRGGRTPRRHRGAGGVTFTADVGTLASGDAAIRAALLRHGCPIMK